MEATKTLERLLRELGAGWFLEKVALVLERRADELHRQYGETPDALKLWDAAQTVAEVWDR